MKDKVWESLIYEQDNLKVYNSHGPARPVDQLDTPYVTYALISTNENWLIDEANTRILSLVSATSCIKPEGTEAKGRPAYIIWRQLPEISRREDDSIISWRMTIYADDPYKRLPPEWTVAWNKGVGTLRADI